jgi:glyoxylase-like metal-dependent hydrolase (beta-lactamase superfamily II)
MTLTFYPPTAVPNMRVERIGEHIHLIDLEPAGIRNFAASYVLKGDKAAIVETGPASTAKNLMLGLEKLGVKPEEVAYVAVSHIHLDHGGAAGTLLKHLPQAKLIVHPRGASHMADPETLWTKSKEALGELAELYGKPLPAPKERIIAAADGMTFDVGNKVRLKAIESLGHASHHLAYHETPGQGIFPGDAAGIYLNKLDAIVPTTPAPYRLDIAAASLKRLISLEPKALYYSHFGKASSPKEKLLAYEKQLRLWEDCARQGIEHRESIQAIGARIIESDRTLKKVEAHIKRHPILGQTVLNQSVEGVVEYVRSHIKL